MQYAIANIFASVCFFRIKPDYIYKIHKLLNLILQQAKREGLIVDNSEAYLSCGQYDIFAIYFSENLVDASKFFFGILDFILQQHPDSLIDYHRSLNFPLKTNNSDNGTLNCIGYANIKYRYPFNRNDLDYIGTSIISDVENHINDDNLQIRLTPYGSFSWNELMLLIYGNDYNNLFTIKDILSKNNLIADNVLVPLRDQYFSSIAFNHQLQFETLFPNQPSPEIHSIISEETTENIFLSRSLNHFIVKFRSSSLTNLNNILRFFSTQITTNFTRTNMIKPIDFDDFVHSKHKHASSSTNPSSQYNLSKISHHIAKYSKQSDPRRKLLSLISHLKILRNNDQFRYILPKTIITYIEQLLKTNDITDETIQYYISEFEAIITQRISGSLHENTLGYDIGLLGRQSSYQCLLLACECMLQKCFNIFNFENDLSEYKNKIFIFFDYGSRRSSTIPQDIMLSKGLSSMPLMVRLKMLKYKPWLWITGLYEISKLTSPIFIAAKLFDTLLDFNGIDAFGHLYLYNFLTDQNFKKVLFEHTGYAECNKDNGYTINHLKEKYVSNIISNLYGRRSFFRNKYINDTLTHEYSKKIKLGTIIFDLSDSESFLNFINAYQELPLKIQMATKAFTSFTLSLYWNHPDIVKDSL